MGTGHDSGRGGRWLNACVLGVGFGADVTIVDINPLRLTCVGDVVQGHVTTLMWNVANVEEAVGKADLVICAVLIPGAKPPRLVTRRRASDGGWLGTGRCGGRLGWMRGDESSDHPSCPRFVAEGVVHYCVSNRPGAVPHTSTYALTNATMAYTLEIADLGW